MKFQLLLVVAVTAYSSAATLHQNFKMNEEINGLTFIGTASNTRAPQPSLYFTSRSLSSWSAAQTACYQLLGYDASLVNVEDADEAIKIAEMLQSSGNNMQSYWTSGKFETGRNNFSWLSGEIIGSGSNLWEVGQPAVRDGRTKLAMKKGTTGFKLHTQSEDAQDGFICELIYGSSEEPIPCYNTNDLVLAIDSSGSIGESNYRYALNFAADVAIAWTGWEDTRIAYIVYSTESETLIHLNNKLNQKQIVEKIKNSKYHNGGTASHLALQSAYREHEVYNRTVEGVPRNLVFLTDGASNDRVLTREQAANLHRAGVRCFAVGIGSGVNMEELNYIASNSSYVFNAEQFANLKNVLKPLTAMACS